MPLMERLKFLAIFTSNLDEFFTIRVAGLHDQVDAGLHDPGPDGRTPSQVIDVLRERILELNERQTRCSQDEVRPALAEHGIRIVGDGRRRPRRARGAQRALPAPDLPRPHAAGGRSRAPVPLHLQPLAVARRPRARPADAGDDLRARQGAQGDAAALRPRGRGHHLRRARAAHRGQPRHALPRDGDRRPRLLPRHARRRLRHLRRGRRPAARGRGRAAPAPLRRGRAPRGRQRDEPAAARRAHPRRSRSRRARSTSSTGCSTSPTCGRSSSCRASATCATRRGRR